jgi:hypothetical protein
MSDDFMKILPKEVRDKLDAIERKFLDALRADAGAAPGEPLRFIWRCQDCGFEMAGIGMNPVEASEMLVEAQGMAHDGRCDGLIMLDRAEKAGAPS